MCGEITQINARGERTVKEFNADRLLHCGYDYYPYYFGRRYVPHSAPSKTTAVSPEEKDSIDELKTVAHYFGYSDDYIDYLLAEGFAIEDIEEVLYCV